MQHIEYTDTIGMDAREVEQRLQSTETGVLSLARDGEAYAIPVAHYYDGERLFFRLGVVEGSKKRSFWEATETACYTLHGADPVDGSRRLDSWSVVATGRLVELPASAHDRFDTAEINRRFAPLRVFGEAVEDIEVVVLEFDIETLTGRRTL
jgi:nitroimidazol reductase NimA-like FMN-containing flavoprotein (pyridoxamine 5'-phosphate oxidase superfamily)